MTVCIAAICGNEGGLPASVIGAADRMLTATDVEFEPLQTKIVTLTSSIALMMAGDAFSQAEIIQRVSEQVHARVQAAPKDWLSVKYVAELYSTEYNQLRTRRSEKKLLAPLGLDSTSFLTRQQELAGGLVDNLASELINYPHLGVSAIVTGVDISGPHIYTIEDGEVRCHDMVGFASIGVGYWHADSQCMLWGHTRNRPFQETLYLVYLAKKRAEIAPGVGEATDMFMIGPLLGSYVSV
ncbi:MAG: hypothetical protein FJY92_09535, partial [Candidatus Hydrogenedentes bacterium]|nr:hypothetical protein [Candidatus Hydrogenedentota bacterium]